MISVVDDRGVTVTLARPPQRIVSLVPSTTETLHHLVGPERIVGVTRFCVHPQPWVGTVAKVGGTKDVDLERVAALEPDLIVGNIEENTKELADAVEGRWPLYMAFPQTVDEAVADLERLGRLVGAEARAAAAVADIAAARVRPGHSFRFLYLIWREPWMAAGSDTFISEMLAEVGGINVVGGRYPEVTAMSLADLGPHLVLLSSEPFPFTTRHVSELSELSGLPEHRFHLVDGELCSWHGVRMAAGLRYLGDLYSS